MSKNLRFWTNVAVIAAAHVAIIVGLIRWSRAEKNAGTQGIVWMNGGAGDGIVGQATNPSSRKESRAEPLKDRDPDEDRPFLASAPSEIQLPTPKPSPTPTLHPRPEKVSPTPKIKGTPKPKPKPTAKPTPKKITLAKALPKQSVKPTPEKVESDQPDSEQKEIAKATPAKEDASEQESKRSPATQTGTGKEGSSGGGHSGGNANDAQFGWYGAMLHDRFYSEWAQPTNVAGAGSKSSVLVKLRIEKDGRISSFEVVRPSGNAELDESVKVLANRVSRVDPLPDGLGKGDHYDVKINFELNSD